MLSHRFHMKSSRFFCGEGRKIWITRTYSSIYAWTTWIRLSLLVPALYRMSGLNGKQPNSSFN